MKSVIHYITSLGLILVGFGIAGGLYLIFEGLIIIPIIILVVTLLSAYFFLKLGKGERSYNLVVKAAEVIELVAIFIFMLLLVDVFSGILWGTSFFLLNFIGSPIHVLIGLHILSLVLLGINKRDVVVPVLTRDITLAQALVVIAVIVGLMGFMNEILSSHFEKGIDEATTRIMYTSRESCEEADYYWYNDTCNYRKQSQRETGLKGELKKEIENLLLKY